MGCSSDIKERGASGNSSDNGMDGTALFGASPPMRGWEVLEFTVNVVSGVEGGYRRRYIQGHQRAFDT